MPKSTVMPRTANLQLQDRVLRMERVKGSELEANPANWREHPASQRQALKGILQEVGIAGALLGYYSERNAGKLTLIDGHLRQEDYGHVDWPVVILNVSDEEADLLLATHDPLAAMAHTNAERLQALIASVHPSSPDMQAMLQNLREQAGLDAPTDKNGRDKAKDDDYDDTRLDEYLAEFGCEVGQLWEIQGWRLKQPHMLLIGNARDVNVANRLLNMTADLLCTDPPYNVSMEYLSHDDAMTDESYRDLLLASFENWQSVTRNQIITPGTPNLPLWYEILPPTHTGVWWRPNSTTHSPIFGWACWDPVLFYGENWPSENKRGSDVFEYPITAQKAEKIGSLTGLHPCPKPLDLWIDLIEHYSPSNGEVVDCFAGSGTVLAACERTGRRAFMVEIDPKYAAVILMRAQGLGMVPKMVESDE